MTMACPRCRSDRVVRFGRREVLRLVIDGGSLVEVPEQVQRHQCKACGHAFAPAIGIHPDVAHEVADLALRLGTRPTADRLGCGIQLVRTILRDWSATKEDVVPLDAPATLSVLALEIGGNEHLVLADLQNETLTDLIPGRQDLADWLSTRRGGPDIAVVGLDPRLARTLKEACHGVELALPVSVSREAMLAAAESGLRSIARKDVGRNFRERTELLDRPDAELSDDERDEISLWSRPAAALRRVVLGMLEALTFDEAGFERARTSCIEALGRVLPGSGMERLLLNWGDAMRIGVRERWVDDVYRRFAGILDRARSLRPRSSLAVVRGVLLLSNVEAPPLDFSAVHGEATVAGRPFDDALESMERHWAG